ncbi:hypothetical protein [Thioalkalivibrio sp. HK1]|uniref:hypothetical protein n=1 Tax=Thioalkalivibrio sp. HK1 TaxID=1469245 RepID=UPI000472206D|nr:hypothetical protein [Thioalkalivibrio sp. HK1]
MSDHEDRKRHYEGVDPALSLSIGNEIRKEIDRATEKIERNMERSVDRIEKNMEKSVDRIEDKVDSVRSELKDDVKRLEDKMDKRLLKVESRTSYILGLLSVIGIVGGILFLRAGGG